MSEKTESALLKTSMGDIKIKLYTDVMPITTKNFIDLVKKGFYDGVIFHRVIKGFMVQGGCPDGTGMGGPGYNIADEFPASAASVNKNNRMTISMANAGPNTGGSQFFLNVVDNNFLDGKHPVFGEIVEGMEIVDKIVNVKTGRQDRPVEDVAIVSAKIVVEVAK